MFVYNKTHKVRYDFMNYRRELPAVLMKFSNGLKQEYSDVTLDQQTPPCVCVWISVYVYMCVCVSVCVCAAAMAP